MRCATRDHLPMVGNVPDYDATLVEYASLAEKKDEAVSAPVYDVRYEQPGVAVKAGNLHLAVGLECLWNSSVCINDLALKDI